jgi:hypothetical protein
MSGESACASSTPIIRLGHAQGVLHRDGLDHRVHLLRPVEQEQVADPVQVDLLPRPLPEVGEGLEAAPAQLDVQRVGEHRAYAAGALARRPAPERGAVEQQHVGHTGLGEVEGGARADDPAPDDHDGRLLRQPTPHARRDHDDSWPAGSKPRAVLTATIGVLLSAL